jgi:hypothetical protein
MSKPKRSHIREGRIRNEAIVDANGPEEQAMGWYYYLENKLRFPFQAKCIAAKVVSPLRKGETVEVRRMAPEDPVGGHAGVNPLAESQSGGSPISTRSH